MKKLFCYDFLTEEDVVANPLKVLFLNDCLGMYDWSMASKFFLDKGVSGPFFTLRLELCTAPRLRVAFRCLDPP